MTRNISARLAFAALALACSGAQAQIAVVMNAAAAPITKDQLSNLYLGRSADLKPVDQPEGTPIRAEFYKKATDRDLAQVKAIWSKIIFTGRGQPPLVLPDAAAVKKAVGTDPKAIGYIEKSAVDASVKVVYSLD
ncbi:MAG: hypothetical protein EOP38_09860 [Rubrivivax sp.]|nr:MAG: hypothetical protein EOP38_09860 [Rubrivivax sp.]